MSERIDPEWREVTGPLDPARHLSEVHGPGYDLALMAWGGCRFVRRTWKRSNKVQETPRDIVSRVMPLWFQLIQDCGQQVSA